MMSLKGMLTIPPELSGLEGAIRLKIDLLQRLLTSTADEWPRQLARFITEFEASELQDATAITVLLADLAIEVLLLSGRTASRISRDPASSGSSSHPRAVQLSKHDLLEEFREELVVWSTQHATPAVSSPLVRRVVAFIDEHYAEPLTLNVLAAVLGGSQRRLASAFRRETGRTIHMHVRHVRISRALTLIRSGEKIEAVSLLVGYRSKKNFYLHFKEIVGVTPMAYKAICSRVGFTDGP